MRGVVSFGQRSAWLTRQRADGQRRIPAAPSLPAPEDLADTHRTAKRMPRPDCISGVGCAAGEAESPPMAVLQLRGGRGSPTYRRSPFTPPFPPSLRKVPLTPSPPPSTSSTLHRGGGGLSLIAWRALLLGTVAGPPAHGTQSSGPGKVCSAARTICNGARQAGRTRVMRRRGRWHLHDHMRPTQPGDKHTST